MVKINCRYLIPVLLACGAGASGLALVIFFPRQVLYEMLALHFLVSAIPSVAILFLAIQILSGSSWWLKFKRIPQSLGNWLPFIAVFWILFLLARKSIYPAEPLSGNMFREVYMNPVFVAFRIITVLFLMILTGCKLLRGIQGFAKINQGSGRRKLVWWSAAYTISFVMFVHVVSWDWVLPFFGKYISVSLSWYVFSVMFQSGISFMTLTLCLQKNYLLAGDHDNRITLTLGKFILAFSLVWAYFSYTQYLLGWYGNLPHEAGYFLSRSTYYGLISKIVLILCFVLPVALLFTGVQKKNRLNMLIASLSVLTGQWLNYCLWILPEFDPAGILLSLITFAIFLFFLLLLVYRFRQVEFIEKKLLFKVAFRVLLAAIIFFPSCREDSGDPGRIYSKDMVRSGAFESYDRNEFLKNGTVMQEAVEGTVNREFSPDHFGKLEEDRQQSADLLTNPVPLNPEILTEGKQLFRTFCINCHGVRGDARGNLVAERIYLYSPARLNTDAVKSLPDGSIYNVITNGFGIMGAHGGILLPGERWRVVHYIKHGL